MNIRSTILLLLISIPFLCLAQIQSEIIILNKTNPNLSIACEDQDAGTITFGNFNGQSNNVDDNVKYFCLGDGIQVLHNGDANLTGDPDPSTEGAIGYLFYDCFPTIDGPDLSSILNDPCIKTINSSPYAYLDEVNGDAYFENTPDETFTSFGILQRLFANFDPVQLWFAPVTFDAVGSINIGIFEENGACINVRTDQTFSIVYLNEIRIKIFTADLTGGTFEIKGGLPEFDNSFYTLIDISLDEDPSIKGTITSNNDGLVEFTVPQEGKYNITVEDGVSCSGSYQFLHFPSTQLTFEIPSTEIEINSNEDFCIQMKTKNFTEIFSMQFGLEYNPEILFFKEANLTEVFPVGESTLVATLPITNEPIIGFSWNTLFGNGITVPDNTAIIDVCFEVVETSDVCTDLEFTQLVSGSVISAGSVNAGEFGADIIKFSDGEICLNFDEMLLNTSFSIPSIELENTEDFCIQMNASDFEDVTSMQFGLAYDASVLTFKEANLAEIIYEPISIFSANPSSSSDSIIDFSWDVLLLIGITVLDNNPIIDICFEVKGAAGDCSNLEFTDSSSGANISVGYADGTFVTVDEIDLVNGEVCIDPLLSNWNVRNDSNLPLDVFPNPSNSEVQFYSNPTMDLSSLKLVNILGQELEVRTNNFGELIRLDLSELSRGIYVLSIEGKEGHYTSKVIHQGRN